MKTILLAVAVWLLTTAASLGQVRALEAGSPEARRAFEEYQRSKPLPVIPGTLSVEGLRVGAYGRPAQMNGKVMQVVDAKQMLVGVEDSRTATGEYRTWVMVKCPTAGITDGKFFMSWKEVTGNEYMKVTGTTTYKTAAGATKTVFVLEGIDDEVKALAEAERKEAEAKQKAAEEARFRTWNDASGKFSVVAKFIEFKDNQVRLERKEDKAIIELPMSRLSKEDQEFIRSELKASAAVRALLKKQPKR